MRAIPPILTLLAVLVFPSFACADSTDPGHVRFKLEAAVTPKGNTNETTWLATYGSNSKFLVSLQSESESTRSLFSGSKGSIEHVSGSDAGPLLKALADALGAKASPRTTKKVKKLAFEVATLGTKETRFSDGSFGNRPGGNWIVSKIFLADGEAEVYLNLDPVSGVGEFALKDEEYADTVLRELASVL